MNASKVKWKEVVLTSERLTYLKKRMNKTQIQRILLYIINNFYNTFVKKQCKYIIRVMIYFQHKFLPLLHRLLCFSYKVLSISSCSHFSFLFFSSTRYFLISFYPSFLSFITTANNSTIQFSLHSFFCVRIPHKHFPFFS